MSTAMERQPWQTQPAYPSTSGRTFGIGLGTAVLAATVLVGIWMLPDFLRYMRIKRM